MSRNLEHLAAQVEQLNKKILQNIEETSTKVDQHTIVRLKDKILKLPTQ